MRVCPEYTCNAQISFLAPVSGTGRLVAGYGNGVDVRSGIVRLAARNTYTGGTLVTSPGLMGLVADYPDSIPDWANAYVTNAYLAARPQIAADGTWSRWSPEAIYAAMNNVQLGLDGHFAIDASDCPGGVFELAAADLVANVPNLDQRGLGTGGGTLRFGDINTAEDPRDLTDPSRIVKQHNLGLRSAVHIVLGNQKMCIGDRRNLCRVCDANDLRFT